MAVEVQQVDAGLSSFFRNTFPEPRALPNVPMVLPDAELLVMPDAQLALMSCQRQNTWQPSSRYKLVRLDENGPGATRISKALFSQRESEPLVHDVMQDMHERIGYPQGRMQQIEKLMHEMEDGIQGAEKRIQGTQEGTQNLQPRKFVWSRGRVYDAMLMFVEYQKDGTWKECCADRAYMCEESKRRLRMVDALRLSERGQ